MSVQSDSQPTGNLRRGAGTAVTVTAVLLMMPALVGTFGDRRRTAQAQTSWLTQRAVASILDMSAHQIDLTLPDEPLREWLQRIAGNDARIDPGNVLFTTCEAVPSEAFPPARGAWPFCARLAVMLPDDRIVGMAFRTSMVRGPDLSAEWRPQSVELANAFIIDRRQRPHVDDSLDVATLAELPAALSLPISKWPRAELSIAADDIGMQPPTFKAGDNVAIAVTVHNIGTAPARVRLYVGGWPECSDVGFGLVAPESAPVETVSAHSDGTFRSSFTAPPLERWYLYVSAEVLPVAQLIRKYEVTSVRKGAGKPIGRGPFKKCVVG